MTTKPVASIVSAALSLCMTAAAPERCASAAAPSFTLMTSPAPRPPSPRMKPRRETSPLRESERWFTKRIASVLHRLCREMDRCTYAHVSRTATDIAVHRGIDVGIGGFGNFGEQRGGRHELAGLAIAALRDIQHCPGFLQRLDFLVRQAFDRRHLAAFELADRRDAGTPRQSVEVHRTGAALGDAATVFRAGEFQFVTQHPEQGGVGLRLHLHGVAIYRQSDHGYPPVAGSAASVPSEHYGVGQVPGGGRKNVVTRWGR